MRISTGIDLVEVNKVQRLLMKHRRYWGEIFTATEIEYCRKKNKNQFQHLAVRFAAKEALAKALGVGFFGGFGLRWIDIEVVNDGLGRPMVNLYGEVRKLTEKMNTKDVSISLSHSSGYAVAHVLLISDG